MYLAGIGYATLASTIMAQYEGCTLSSQVDYSILQESMLSRGEDHLQSTGFGSTDGRGIIIISPAIRQSAAQPDINCSYVHTRISEVTRRSTHLGHYNNLSPSLLAVSRTWAHLLERTVTYLSSSVFFSITTAVHYQRSHKN